MYVQVCEFLPTRVDEGIRNPCGGGTRFRTREVLNYARYGGEICQGDAKEVEACNQQPCPSKYSFSNKAVIYQ